MKDESIDKKMYLLSYQAAHKINADYPHGVSLFSLYYIIRTLVGSMIATSEQK